MNSEINISTNRKMMAGLIPSMGGRPSRSSVAVACVAGVGRRPGGVEWNGPGKVQNQ